MTTILDEKDLYLDINGIKFKSFIEECQETFEFKEANLSYLSVNEQNNFLTTRIVNKVKFVFNVYSDSEEEMKTNVANLASLKNSLKPIYVISEGSYYPYSLNFIGHIKIQFPGLFTTRTFKELHLLNFSYEINKETGFLELENRLNPISYRVSIEGLVTGDLFEQANVTEKNETKFNPAKAREKAKRQEEENLYDFSERKDSNKIYNAILTTLNALGTGQQEKARPLIQAFTTSLNGVNEKNLKYDEKNKKINGADASKLKASLRTALKKSSNSLSSEENASIKKAIDNLF